MAHLNPEAAKWQLYELEERQEEIVAIEVFDRGNVSTRLVRCVDETEVERRFALNRTRAYAHARDGSRTLVLRGSRVPLSWPGIRALAAYSATRKLSQRT